MPWEMPWEHFWPVVLILIGAAALLLVVEVVYRGLRYPARRLRRYGEKVLNADGSTGQRYALLLARAPESLVERLYRPTQLLAATLGALAFAAEISNDDLDAIEDGLVDGVYLSLIWLGLVVILWLAGTIGGLTFAGSDMARRFRSQVDTLSRILSVLAAVAVLVVTLINLDHARALGSTVLAGAGLIGAVAGLAAQKTLANMFAGIAIGFNDKLNIGDVIEIDGQSGEIIERTLTYVVVKLSGQRNLVLPTSQFLDKAHTNWQLTRRKVVGWVPLTVDWGVDVAALEAELRRCHPHHYGQASDLRVEVIDVTDSAVQVRAMVKASPDDLWDVQCEVRRHLVDWINANQAARPRLRTDVALTDATQSVSPPRQRARVRTRDRKGKQHAVEEEEG